MHKIISYKKLATPSIQDDVWQVIRSDKEQLSADLPDGKLIVPFTMWLAEQHNPQWTQRIKAGDIAVWFGVEDDVQLQADVIQQSLGVWPLIAIDFPIYRDGRGFSTAAILRKRFTADKEIRAIGDVLVDQLIQMARVGFDSFDLRADQSIEVGLAQFSIYHVSMQNDWRSARSQLKTVIS
jgi:uncharacterized protein (DUF934 family)